MFKPLTLRGNKITKLLFLTLPDSSFGAALEDCGNVCVLCFVD